MIGRDTIWESKVYKQGAPVAEDIHGVASNEEGVVHSAHLHVHHVLPLLRVVLLFLVEVLHRVVRTRGGLVRQVPDCLGVQSARHCITLRVGSAQRCKDPTVSGSRAKSCTGTLQANSHSVRGSSREEDWCTGTLGTDSDDSAGPYPRGVHSVGPCAHLAKLLHLVRVTGTHAVDGFEQRVFRM